MRELIKNLSIAIILAYYFIFILFSGFSKAASPPVLGRTSDGRPPGLSESGAFEYLANALSSDSRLHGAWVFKEGLEANPQNPAGRYVLGIIVDKDQASFQEANVRRLLESTPFDRPYRIGTVSQLPLSQLIQQINFEIEAQKGLDGCYITGASFETSQFGGEMVDLIGRVASLDQRSAIIRTCNEQMVEFADWRNATRTSGLNVVPNTKGAQLILRSPSPTAAAVYYVQGLEQFRGGQFDEAAAKFKNAVIELPSEQVYRYWLILSELRMGRREMAYKRLSTLVRRGDDTPNHDVYMSLEKIQGPLRMELVTMEANAKAGLPYQGHNAQTNYASVVYRTAF